MKHCYIHLCRLLLLQLAPMSVFNCTTTYIYICNLLFTRTVYLVVERMLCMMSTIILLYLVVGTDSYKNPCPSDMPFAVLDTVLMKDCLFGSGNNDNPYGSASTGSPDYYCQKGIAIDNTDTVCSYHGTYQSPNHLVPWGQRNKHAQTLTVAQRLYQFAYGNRQRHHSRQRLK